MRRTEGSLFRRFVYVLAGWAVCALVLVGGCGGEQVEPAPPVEERQDTTAPSLPAGASPSEAAPETVSDVGHDPQALLQTVREVVQGINTQLGGLVQQEQTLPPEKAGWEPRTLRLWLADGAPVKLVATEPTGAGTMTGESVYYYQHGMLLYVQHPSAGYVFDEGQIVLWVNENMRPVTDVPEQTVSDRAASVQQESQRYLAAFGVQ
jgi:hypothetical protein